MMVSEKYDEITRNNHELEATLQEKYKGESITFDVLANEIKALAKVIFIPSSVLNTMQLTPDLVGSTLKEKELMFVQLAGMKNEGNSLLGVLVSTEREHVQNALNLYNATYSESVGQSRH